MGFTGAGCASLTVTQIFLFFSCVLEKTQSPCSYSVANNYQSLSCPVLCFLYQLAHWPDCWSSLLIQVFNIIHSIPQNYISNPARLMASRVTEWLMAFRVNAALQHFDLVCSSIVKACINYITGNVETVRLRLTTNCY